MLPLTESLPGIRGCREGLSLRPGPPGGRLHCSLCFGDCVRCGDLMVNKTEYCPLWNAWKYLHERRWYWLNYIVTSSCFVHCTCSIVAILLPPPLSSEGDSLSLQQSQGKGGIHVATESNTLSQALRMEGFREARTMQHLCPTENPFNSLKGELT